MAGISAKAIWPLIEKHKARAEDERREWDQYDSWYSSEYWDAERVGESYISPTVAGTVNSTDDDLSVQTNYPYAFVDTMIANVCPTNPQLSIAARASEYKDLAAANEALINDSMRRNGLHEILWEACTHTSISGRGVTRTVWNAERKRPVTYVVDPRAFFYDMTVPWEFSRYACEAVPITEAEWKERLGRGSKFKYNKEAAAKASPAGYPKWLRKHAATKASKEGDASKEHFNWVVLYEFYDFSAGMYYQFAEDVHEPLMQAKISDLFKYMSNPYTLIIFNKNLRENAGISDIKLIASSQRRLNELDSLELQHVHTSLPVDYVNVSLLDNPDEFEAQINGGLGPNDIVRMNVRNEAPITAVIQSRPASQLSTAHLSMRERVVAQIEFTLGIPAYSRGKVGTSEVATELALADTATRTRNGRRIKIVGDAVVDIGKKYGALWHEYLGTRSFPVRSRGDDLKLIIADASSLGIQDEAPEAEPIITWEDNWWFDMEAVPFSPTENHRLVQLNKLQTFLEPLMQMPNVDNRRLVQKLLELLGFDDIFTDEEQAPPPEPGAAQLQQAPEGPEGIASGGMPESTGDFEDMAAVTSRDLAVHPQN